MPTASLPPDVVHACVVAGATDTHYFRAGRGDAVLLLAGNARTAQALFERLPRDFSLIAPDMRPRDPGSASPAQPDFTAWIRGFLDTLGLRRLSVIADPCFAAGALGFTMIERDRVAGLVVLLGACGDLASGDGGIADRLDRSGQPLLAIRFDLADPDSLAASSAEIVAFLLQIAC